MKKIYTFLSLILILNLSFAQTFTFANFQSGSSTATSIKIANANSFNSNLISITGSGVSWDASTLIQTPGTPVVQFVYGNPSSTPNGSLFPNSNFVQYDPALTSLISYNYYGINSDSMVTWGSYDPSTSHEIYTNPDKRIVFPFSFNQTFTDTYSKTNYSNATTISSYQTGNRTVSFNGYGTLILPQGTISNVALISETRTNSLGPNSTYYSWWDLTTGKQLLFYSENNGNVTLAFNSSISTELKNNIETTSNFYVFPNPSNGEISISGISVNTNNLVEIYNLLGQVVYTEKIILNNSTLQLNPNLLPGNYLIKISNSKSSSFSKITIL